MPVTGGSRTGFLPTLHRKEVIEKANEEYARSDILKFAYQASVQEAECFINRGIKRYVLHPTKPRVQETCEFAQKMGYRKLGIAFCSGLHGEAHSLTEILETRGFEVISVACKTGGTPKEQIGIKEEDKNYLLLKPR